MTGASTAADSSYPRAAGARAAASLMPALAVAAVALSGAPSFGLAGAQRAVSHSGTVAADAQIEIYNVAGTINVAGWDRNEVRVEGELGPGVDRLEFNNDGDEVEIAVVVRRARRRDPAGQVGDSHLDIMVPRGASLQVEALGASITVTDVSGAVRMESAAGNMTFSGDSSEIEADAAAGDIEVTTSSRSAEIDVEGTAGSVVVQLAGGDVSAGTVTGSLRVIGGRIREGRFESVSGRIYFEGEIAGGGELDFENFNGDIDLLIPEDASARFDITTYSGSIETEFGFSGSRREPFSPEREAEFTLGAGAAEVSVETFAGRVSVRKR